MESRFIEEGLKVKVFSQVQFSVRPIVSLRVSKFLLFSIQAFLERKPVANSNNFSYSSWFYVFICPIKITYKYISLLWYRQQVYIDLALSSKPFVIVALFNLPWN